MCFTPEISLMGSMWCLFTALSPMGMYLSRARH